MALFEINTSISSNIRKKNYISNNDKNYTTINYKNGM